MLSVTVPGEPVAQGRPRAFKTPSGFIRTYDPAKSRSWKGTAQVHYQAALTAAGLETPAFGDGALELVVVAVFTCPKSHWRKTPVPRRPKAGRPDPDNVAKSVLDSGNGLLWRDDSQVARLVVEKFVGAQGEAPRVEIHLRALPVVEDRERPAASVFDLAETKP